MALALPETDIEHWIIVLLIILLSGFRLRGLIKADEKDLRYENLIKSLFESINGLEKEVRNLTNEIIELKTTTSTYAGIIEKQLKATSPVYVFKEEEEIKKTLEKEKQKKYETDRT